MSDAVGPQSPWDERYLDSPAYGAAVFTRGAAHEDMLIGQICQLGYDVHDARTLARGITTIERVMTDNAFAYRIGKDFQQALTTIGAKHKLTKPHCPWQNGKVERYNRTLQTEWAYRQVFTSNQDRHDALDPWLEHYNRQQHHSALKGNTPISQVSPTS